MTYQEAIDLLRGEPDWWRLEYYGRDTNPDAALRDRTRAEAIRRASEPLPRRPTVQESISLLERMHKCYFWSKGNDGCGCGHCGITQAKTTHQQCFSCLTQYPDLRP